MDSWTALPLKYNRDERDALFFIAGPCVIESLDICFQIAESLALLSQTEKTDIFFKASFDKANRTSVSSFRGPGLDEGLAILQKVKDQFGLPVVTDIHEPAQAAPVAEVADLLQIPAFLSRQTDLLVAAGKTGKAVNIKKGQFLSPADMKYALDKCGPTALITERGTFFGYNRLVVDFTAIQTLHTFGRPVVFDATHSVQTPGGGEGCSGGNRAMALPLARAALSVGYNGLFFEIHPDPDKALCDGPNSLALPDFIAAVPKFIRLKKEVDSWDSI